MLPLHLLLTRRLGLAFYRNARFLSTVLVELILQKAPEGMPCMSFAMSTQI